MSRKRVLQSIAPQPEQRTGAFDAADHTRQIVTPYLTSREAVLYLKLPSLGALYGHIRENRLPTLRAGGGLRFDVRELDAWLRGTTVIELIRQKRRA
jgi:hypothetical protein